MHLQINDLWNSSQSNNRTHVIHKNEIEIIDDCWIVEIPYQSITAEHNSKQR